MKQPVKDAPPKLFLIAGPNGAGKTTYAFRHIRQVAGAVEFVNLDEIARGLSPLDPAHARARAARVAIAMTRDFINARTTFSLETTLAGRTHLQTLQDARARGFDVVVLYFSPVSEETCLSRISRRVSEGGHDVPEADVRRRFVRSAQNLDAYCRLADIWRVFDVATLPVRVAAEGRAGCVSILHDNAAIAPQVKSWIEKLPACEEV